MREIEQNKQIENEKTGDTIPSFDVFAPIQEEAKSISASNNKPENYQDEELDITSRVSDIAWAERLQNVGLKSVFSVHVIIITYIWIGMVCIAVLVTMIANMCGNNGLSDAVLITALSSTSLSVVLGLLYRILRYLFNPSEKSH